MPEKPFALKVDFLTSDGTLIRGSDGRLEVVSGTAGTWIMRLRVLAARVEPGAVIEWRRFNIHLAGALQSDHPQRRDYVTAECTSGVPLQWRTQGDQRITIVTGGSPLHRGDEIVIRLGDRRSGSVGSEIFWTTTRGRFTVALGEGAHQRPAADDFIIDVTCHPDPDCLRLLGPTVAAPGEPFDLHLSVFDRNRSLVLPFTGDVCFDAPDCISGLPDAYTFTFADEGVHIFEGVTVRDPGVHRIGVSLDDGSLATRSNPIVCRADSRHRVYWGDLHAHGWGDCTMLLMHDPIDKLLPASRHDQGHRIGRFDYSAPGAMSMPPGEEDREEIWRAYQDAFEARDEPGHYVPFLSMEMHPGAVGDRQLFFKGQTDIPIDMREGVEKVYGLYGDREDAMLEVHIGGAPPYYEQFRPDREALVEVVSAFGNAEWLLQKCLQEGYRPAITGASDLHVGLQGAPRAVETFRGRFARRLRVRDSGFGSGPVGALVADRCEREALWTSLRERRGYATTGDRIHLEVDAAGHSMGEVAQLPERFDLTLTVHAQEPIERIDLIVGEHLADSLLPNELDVEWTIPYDRAAMPPGRWFYFRVRQSNWEYAWTAPIWFADGQIWFADGQLKGDAGREWPAWNHAEAPATVETPELREHLAALEAYLTLEDDRRHFAEILPVGIFAESMGRNARFISRFQPENYPVTLRWFFEFEIPKLRVDWGYDNFGPVDCWEPPVPIP